jgi:hypothetical protein
MPATQPRAIPASYLRDGDMIAVDDAGEPLYDHRKVTDDTKWVTVTGKYSRHGYTGVPYLAVVTVDADDSSGSIDCDWNQDIVIAEPLQTTGDQIARLAWHLFTKANYNDLSAELLRELWNGTTMASRRLYADQARDILAAAAQGDRPPSWP